MKKGIVYCAYNKINGKRYIGQTIQKLSERKSAHYSKNNTSYFHSALKKYKKEDWEWKIIDYGRNKEELNNKEIFWISFFNTTCSSNGYNIQKGGQGRNQTIEEIKKARDASVRKKEKGKQKEKIKQAIRCVETGNFLILMGR